jgi:hypothetical protein
MKLVGQLVRTAVNIVTLPVAVAKDITGEPIITGKSATMQQLKKIKDEADER